MEAHAQSEHHRLHPDEGALRGAKGLKEDAIGFLDGGHRSFFGRKTETVDPEVAAGRKVAVAAVPEEAI
jgi:hypothetical protein